LNVNVHESGIAGLGVLAGTPFRCGDPVLEIDDSRVVDDVHPLGHSESPQHRDYLANGKVILMQFPERYINHSCDPNVYVATVEGKRLVIALCDIPAGEEIAYDYCINGGGDTLWTCHCGAARCRYTIHSDFFHLPHELQREYLPLLDVWFQNERSAETQQLRSRLNVT
jgi:uncharacterized protein